MNMKKYLNCFICGVIIALSSCNDGSVITLRQNQVVGLWGYSDDSHPAADGRYRAYYEFCDDGTMAYYTMLGDTVALYNRGTYTIEDHRLSFVYKHYRVFEKLAGLFRCTYNNTDPDLWRRFNFLPTACTKSRITMIGTEVNKNSYLHAVKQLPPEWNNEFSAPEIAVTEDALLAQWDQLNMFVCIDDGWNYYYYYQPENNGITLLPDGNLTRCVFWVNYVWQAFNEAGDIADNEYITIYNQDCTWSLSDRVLTLTCSRYIKYNLDMNGQPANVREVALRTPYKKEFWVFELTDYYLTLLNEQNGYHHVFYRQPLPANAPQQIEHDRNNVQKNLPPVDACGQEWRRARVGTYWHAALAY